MFLWSGRRGFRWTPRKLNRIHCDRKRNILESLLSERDQAILELVAYLSRNVFRNTDSPGGRERFQPRCNVHSIAVHVPAHSHNITKVQTDPYAKLTLGWLTAVAHMECPLDFHRTAGGFQSTCKLHEEGITRGLNFPTVELGNDGPQNTVVLFKHRKRKRLIRLCKRAEADHVSEHDGDKGSLLLHVLCHENRCGKEQAREDYGVKLRD